MKNLAPISGRTLDTFVSSLFDISITVETRPTGKIGPLPLAVLAVSQVSKPDNSLGDSESPLTSFSEKTVSESSRGLTVVSASESIVSEFARGSVDLLQVDGQLPAAGGIETVEQWLSKLSPHGAVVFLDLDPETCAADVLDWWQVLGDKHPERTLALQLLHRVGVYTASSNHALLEFMSIAKTGEGRIVLEALARVALRKHHDWSRFMVERQAEVESLQADQLLSELAARELRDQLKNSSGMTIELQEHIEQLQARVHRMKATLSWRLTIPFRVIGSVFRRRRKK